MQFTKSQPDSFFRYSDASAHSFKLYHLPTGTDALAPEWEQYLPATEDSKLRSYSTA